MSRFMRLVGAFRGRLGAGIRSARMFPLRDRGSRTVYILPGCSSQKLITPNVAFDHEQRRGWCTESAERPTVLDEYSWSEAEFKNSASRTLEDLLDAVEESAELRVGDEFDAEFSGDVLNLRFGAGRGTYVLNLQTPNRQIWMSSPVSGPWRFHYDPTKREWRSTRSGQSLHEMLDRELYELVGIHVTCQYK